jgi:cereblon
MDTSQETSPSSEQAAVANQQTQTASQSNIQLPQSSNATNQSAAQLISSNLESEMISVNANALANDRNDNLSNSDQSPNPNGDQNQGSSNNNNENDNNLNARKQSNEASAGNRGVEEEQGQNDNEGQINADNDYQQGEMDDEDEIDEDVELDDDEEIDDDDDELDDDDDELDDDDDEIDDDDEMDDDADFEFDQMESNDDQQLMQQVEANNEEYERSQKPVGINYDLELATTHKYLGENFEQVSHPKSILEQNDQLTIPLINTLTGPHHFHNFYDDEETSSNLQLLPGQVMPVYFYSPLQVQMIRKRMREADPTVGFALSSKSIKYLLKKNKRNENNENPDGERDQEASGSSSTPQHVKLDDDEMRIGVLAEIISSRADTRDGLVLMVRGRERFRILKLHQDITGCVIADVQILPDYILNANPLLKRATPLISQFYGNYLHKHRFSPASEYNKTTKTCIAKAEYYNTMQPTSAWLFRKYDCDCLMYEISKELYDTFNTVPNFYEKRSTSVESTAAARASSSSSFSCSSFASSKCDEDLVNTYKDPLIFSNWLINNFPFDNRMRINCLKLNCVNQRLVYMYSLLKMFTSINCRNCGVQICSKSDVFSMSKQGFMQAYLNPGGVVHETLTVYKAKNLSLVNSRPSTEHSWFPGYGWQICSCSNCNCHIGWKFTSTNNELIPNKFWGLTRKAVRYSFVQDNDAGQSGLNSVSTTTVATIVQSD